MKAPLTGTEPWQPNFSISIEEADITEEVRQNLVSLSLTDNGGNTKQSDQIVFAVASDTLKLPPKGVKVSIAMGFGEELVDKGTYIVDAMASGGSNSAHRIVQITARAFSKTNARGHSALQSQKTRSWSGVSLGDVVKSITAEHQLAAAIPEELANIQIEHIDQLGESDMNLLTRLAGRYGAVSKVTHDNWVITPRGSLTTVSGTPLKKYLINRNMVGRWSYQSNSDSPDTSTSGGGTQIISYKDMTDGGKTKTLTIGSGEPVIQYSWPQPDLQSAREIAAGFSTGSKKKLVGMNVGLIATPELMNLTAQCLITTQGFGSEEDKDWHISRLNMDLTNQGFLVSLDLE
ncbi:late control protein [Buttiauxella sp. 3AFRM03]|uniref:phage late control D family protein n=1 Tax=Buttiauxella sp. 3AFRM03 TaxID=2479367 RepID=UPI000EF7B91C|nr:contractile injection system protein, VgrG/Pvc8 family [Buttiauxella sp. 3AFRM03]AYN30017.1 late control protein [Buttiauxella sp. 3AFRM03]